MNLFLQSLWRSECFYLYFQVKLEHKGLSNMTELQWASGRARIQTSGWSGPNQCAQAGKIKMSVINISPALRIHKTHLIQYSVSSVPTSFLKQCGRHLISSAAARISPSQSVLNIWWSRTWATQGPLSAIYWPKKMGNDSWPRHYPGQER